MNIADRVARLGTETAFAVSAEATAFAAQGNKVYPFHLGDLNLKTPANVLAAGIKAMQEGKTGYCANAGVPQLREILADDVSATRNAQYCDGKRRHPAGRQADHRQIFPDDDESRR